MSKKRHLYKPHRIELFGINRTPKRLIVVHAQNVNRNTCVNGNLDALDFGGVSATSAEDCRDRIDSKYLFDEHIQVRKHGYVLISRLKSSSFL